MRAYSVRSRLGLPVLLRRRGVLLLRVLLPRVLLGEFPVHFQWVFFLLLFVQVEGNQVKNYSHLQLSLQSLLLQQVEGLLLHLVRLLYVQNLLFRPIEVGLRLLVLLKCLGGILFYQLVVYHHYQLTPKHLSAHH